MAWNIRERKSEHAGAKHGNGAYWGRKWIAKHASNIERRRNARRAVVAAFEEIDQPYAAPAISERFGATVRRVRRNTRRWCAGKVGRPHEFVLRETVGEQFGLPPLHLWRCTRCGRKAYNLRQGATFKAPLDPKQALGDNLHAAEPRI